MDYTGFILVDANEYSPGVFVAGYVTKVINCSAIVRIVYVNPFPVKLQLSDIKYKIFKYEIYQNQLSDGCNNCISSSVPNKNSRFDKLLKELNIDDNLSKEEKTSILKLREEFQQLVFLKGDCLTHTNSITHRIPTDSNAFI